MRLLSSTTFVGLNGFQAVLCVAGGLVFIAVGVNAREWGFVAASLIWFAGAVFLVSIGRQHWEVWLEADGVRVRKAKTQLTIPFSSLVRVEDWTAMQPPSISLVYRDAAGLEQTVGFVPAWRWHPPFTTHPITRDLRAHLSERPSRGSAA